MSTISQRRNEQSHQRLDDETRLLCVVGAIMAAVVVTAALLLFPYAWSHRAAKLLSLAGEPCLLKATTGVPCPFCGATRATVAAAHLRFARSFRLSPLGIPVFFGSLALALWLGACAATGRDLRLAATGRFLRGLPMGKLLGASLLLLWGVKIVADCVLKWN